MQKIVMKGLKEYEESTAKSQSVVRLMWYTNMVWIW
jgi:hypothetical protein